MPTSRGRPARLALLALALPALTLLAACSEPAPKPPPPQKLSQRSCGSAERFQHNYQTDPEFRRRADEVEARGREWVKTFRGDGGVGLRGARVIIPVVVHVLWNTAGDNISDAEIQGQIDVLNEDYRALNADVSIVPSGFQPLVGDSRIEFRLAARAPGCTATNGITRTSTSRTFFSVSAEDAKSTSTGGMDPWPTDRYLNLWVVPDVRWSGATILGYSSFPSDPAHLQGVVIGRQFFGRSGTAPAPFDLGRTTTHEIGHFFNLRHIWADDTGSSNHCTGSDLVDDTPNQGGPNFDCPTFPRVSCSNGPLGDLFVNYMDYVDDACMVMFTHGQNERKSASLYTVQASLIASDGHLPPPAAGSADLFSQDSPEDLGAEPNSSSTSFYRSQDIWVRRQPDGIAQQEHENPLYRPSGPPNYVYVRVRNRGCADAASATLRLYWAKASTGLSWPAPWDGSVTSPALMGGSIGSAPTGVVVGGGSTILQFPWNPPNPADYAAMGADRTHFCLLARIETSSSAPFGMTFPEGSNLHQNVSDNNGIVWKNVSVTEPGSDGSRMSSVLAANHSKESMRVIFALAPLDRRERPILTHWRVVLDLGPELYERWRKAGRQGEQIEDLGAGRVEFLSTKSHVSGIELVPGEMHAIGLAFLPRQPNPPPGIYEADLLQYDRSIAPGKLVGGQRFTVLQRP